MGLVIHRPQQQGVRGSTDLTFLSRGMWFDSHFSCTDQVLLFTCQT